MRKPNGYGSVLKLSGARRKPYAVRIHTGYKENGTSQYKYIGYYASRKEAENALAIYNTNPYEINGITFAQVYQNWKQSEMQNMSHATQTNKQYAYGLFASIHNVAFNELKAKQVQDVIWNSKPSTQVLMKALFQNLETYAIKYEITNKSFSKALSTTKVIPKNNKKIFSEEQIDELWMNTNISIVREALILIYTGFRISEYMALTKDSIQDGCFVGGVKTEAGRNRYVPIHPRIMPFVQERLEIITDGTLSEFSSTSGMRQHWNAEPLLNKFTFHECRHTFRSRLDNADANETCINLLMGHKGDSVGKSVYTHKTIEQLRSTIALLK